MAENKTIILKLLVDKKKNKVVFAEADKDFVDVLFSFLTIPIGTIVRLAKKQSKLGCMDALYKSVEALDRKNFETEACKSMLLMPRNAYEYKNRNLVVDVCNYPLYYICPTWTCVTETNCLLSVFENTKCHCGTNMDKPVLRKPEKITEGDELNGVFVKGIRKFIISDDLVVREVCNETSLSTLRHFNIEEARSAEERIVSVGANQLVLKLLFRSLLSTTPLSDVFLSNRKWVDAIMKRSVSLDIKRVLNLLSCSLLSKTPLSDVLLSKREWISPNMIRSESVDIKPQVPRTALDTKMVSLTLLIKKPNKSLYMGKRNEEKVVYAAAKENFLDFLFSFLAFPMGSVLELLGRDSSIRSIDNLYKSVEDMCNGNPAQFKECNDILLHPKVAAHHSCENQLLQMEEDLPVTTVLKCLTCFKGKVAVDQGGVCGHGLDREKLSFVNPKFLDTVVKRGNGFLKKSRMFMVTDELIVEPLSPISSVSFVNKLGVPLSKLEERIVSVGEKEARSILKASLTSRTALTSVFCQRTKDPTRTGVD